ncbi:MAG: T9SS type A sorting domain-containing protein [Bacteroidota bacterium]|nr:T9SS type A sorting domain-containing protein [Bacteroidota bacterium]
MKKFILSTFLIFGSYFAQAQTIYVNGGASGLNDGTSWADAYTDLQSAITAASSGEIWVAQGAYYTGTSGATSSTFLLKNNVAIYGGFNGTETFLAQRDIVNYVSVLTGDLDFSGTFTANDAYHVVTAGQTNSSAILDGFMIIGGNASGGGGTAVGGGFFCDPNSPGTVNPTINNCIFSGNNAVGNGGAVFIVCDQTGGNSTAPKFNNCTFRNNNSLSLGGAVYMYATGSLTFCTPFFENCLFHNNAGAGSANEIYAENMSTGEVHVTVTNCTFATNSPGAEIQYVANGINGTFDIHNSIFYGLDLVTDAAFNANNNCGDPTYLIGTGNINVDPLFINAGTNDYRLACFSPCFETGNNTYPTLSVDITESPRIFGTNVDIGAYESQYTLPNVIAMPSSTAVCEFQSVTLSGSGADTYVWDNGVTDGMPFSPTVTTLYTVVGSNLAGCNDTDMVTITVNPNPLVTATANVPGVCEGDQVFLYGTGAMSYSWDNGVSDGIPFSPISTMTYNVTGTDANGCVGMNSVMVTVENRTGFTAGPDVDVCRSGTPYVTLAGGNNVGNTFNWTTIGSGSFVNGGTMSPDYYLSGADASGTSVQIVLEIYHTYCVNEQDTLVLYMQDPTSSFAGADIAVCSDFASSVSVNGSASSYSSILWTTSGTGSFVPDAVSMSTSYAPSSADISAGTVTLTFTSSALNPACPNVVDDLLLNIHPSPVVTLPADYAICETDSIYLNGTITGGTAPFIYNWNDGLMTTISTANNEYYFPSASDSYTLTVNDSYGCGSSGLLTVAVDASETLSGNLNVGAGSLSDGVMYVLKFSVQQLAFDTFFVYPFSAGTGSYSFPSMPHGNYLIKVVPDTVIFPNLLPTYYGDAFQWDSATVINHSCTGAFVADINMIQLLGGTGTGTISGEIREGDGFGSRPGKGHHNVFAPGGPLKGVDVKLGKNPGGGIQARTISDSTGYYEFTNLPDDSYRIYVDIPGLPMDSFYVVNVQADSTIDLDYYADSNSVFPILPTAVGIHQYVANTSNFGVYPNPAHNNTSIIFELTSTHAASIRLMDITGKQVMNIQLNKLPKGKHEYQLNFSNQQLSSGVYFIQVMSDAGMQTKKLVIE